MADDLKFVNQMRTKYAKLENSMWPSWPSWPVPASPACEASQARMQTERATLCLHLDLPNRAMNTSWMNRR